MRPVHVVPAHVRLCAKGAAMNRACFLQASLLVGLTCCNTAIVEPSMDIQVTRESAGYKFSFKDCGRTWLPDGPMPVSDVTYGRVSANPVRCRCSAK